MIFSNLEAAEIGNETYQGGGRLDRTMAYKRVIIYKSAYMIGWCGVL